MPWINAVPEVAHYMALGPLLVLLCLFLFGKKRPLAFWLVAWGFAVSWFGDFYGARHPGEFTARYFWFPLQAWVVLVAFLRPPHRILSAVWLGLLVPVSMYLSWPHPEHLLTVVGSVAILRSAKGALRWPLYLYFGIGTLCYLVLFNYGAAYAWSAYLAYQGFRALAFVCFIGVIAPPMISATKGETRHVGSCV